MFYFFLSHGHKQWSSQHFQDIFFKAKALRFFRCHSILLSVMVLFLGGGWFNAANAELPVGSFSASVRSVNADKCLDVAGASKTSVARVLQYTCHESLNQTIFFTPVTEKPGVYSLKFAHSGQCLSVFIGIKQEGAAVVQNRCNGNLNQQFALQDLGDSRYRLIVQHTKKSLDVKFSSKLDGASVIQYTQQESDSQKWQLTSITALNNPIQIENALPGMAWEGFPIATNHEIEGYASKTAVDPLQVIDFFVNAQVDAAYTLTIYRLGWYNGTGIRQLTEPVSLPGIKQLQPVADPATGLVEANWRTSYSFTIPQDWVSGYYLATVVGQETGLGQYIAFVVTNNGRYSDYLIQSPVATWQAFNKWGGKSLFAYNSTENKPARKVSFNRPYEGLGAGGLTNWELNMLRFMERGGYDVAYQTDLDTHLDGTSLWTHKALLVPGQSEFWTSDMRDHVEFARSHGQGLGFFGANACYWQARLEPSSTQQNARTLVGYKDYAATEDPYALDADASNDRYITTQWRLPPVNRPENALVGIMYAYEPVSADVVITNASHWVFAGTNLHNGDKLPSLLGSLVDTYVDNGQATANTEVLAHSPVKPNIYGDMSVYSIVCQAIICVNPAATVFASGTLNWSSGLDDFGNGGNFENAAAKQITRNVLARLVNAKP
jgi:hypothetical protein